MHILVHFNIVGQQALLGSSYIVELPKAPSTVSDFSYIDSILTKESGGRVIIKAWSIMPDAATHPTKIEAYKYFVTFNYNTSLGDGGDGSVEITRSSMPIYTLTDLRNIEEFIRTDHHCKEVRLVTCTALEQ